MISYLDTLALGQTDPWLFLTNDEDVAFPCSEGVVNGVLDVNDVETTIMSLTVSDDTNTTHVTIKILSTECFVSATENSSLANLTESAASASRGAQE